MLSFFITVSTIPYCRHSVSERISSSGDVRTKIREAVKKHSLFPPFIYNTLSLGNASSLFYIEHDVIRLAIERLGYLDQRHG